MQSLPTVVVVWNASKLQTCPYSLHKRAAAHESKRSTDVLGDSYQNTAFHG